MGKENNGLAKIPLLGRLAIKNSLVTEQEFDEAMMACSKATDPEEALRKYFLANDLITPKNLKRLVTATKAVTLRQKDIKFGTIAVNKGLISQSVLDLVIEEQNQSFKTGKNPRLIGDMLVEAGIITISHRNLILKTQNRLIKEIQHNYTSTDKSIKNPSVSDSNTTDTKTAGQKPESPTPNTIETIKYGINLEITHDKLTALLSKTETFDDSINPDDIRDILIKKGITFGIVSNDFFSGFIKSSGFKSKKFIAAKGIKPVRGENARVEYFFDIDYLKAGGLSASGKIDFKDRGIIPQVEAGTVLSEKIPQKKSSNGKTVFGEELIIDRAEDMKLRYGTGVKLSEDRLKTIASVDGSPKLTWAGLVVVNKEYTTTGDVSYKTGHIKYDGNIKIKGCIKNGFKVNGNDISAKEIEGGVIHAEGNLNITNGINDATIYARGNVYTKFIHSSKIICMGNIYIAKEIVDSTIETSGACITKDGKIISCKITAKMGVFAKQLGTELSEPNIIKTGHNTFVNKEIATIKDKISTLIKEKKKQERKKETLINENKKYHTDATSLANMQEKSLTSQQKIGSLIDSAIKNAGDKKKIADFKKTLITLKNKESKINQQLTECFDKIEHKEKQLETNKDSLLKTQQNIDDLRNEKKHLSEWNHANPGDTTIKVTGVVFPGTIVQGRHSEKRIKEKLTNSKIKELMYQDDDDKQGRHQYEMIIT